MSRCLNCPGCPFAGGLFGRSCVAAARRVPVGDEAGLQLRESLDRAPARPVQDYGVEVPLAARREYARFKLCYEQSVGVQSRLAWRTKMLQHLHGLVSSGFDVRGLQNGSGPKREEIERYGISVGRREEAESARESEYAVDELRASAAGT